jgi:hypothetical protein
MDTIQKTLADTQHAFSLQDTAKTIQFRLSIYQSHTQFRDKAYPCQKTFTSHQENLKAENRHSNKMMMAMKTFTMAIQHENLKDENRHSEKTMTTNLQRKTNQHLIPYPQQSCKHTMLA